MVSVLREQGVPARMRVGYSRYTSGPDRYDNHFVCEYHNGKRWVLLDAQMDEAQRKLHALDFDTTDLPPGKFITATEAWKGARNGTLNVDLLGVNGPKGWESQGWKTLQIDMLADSWALNKVELITGETNALGRKPHEQWTREELESFDDLAGYSGDPVGLDKILHGHPALQIDLKAWKP
jgi:hypothetical protein